MAISLCGSRSGWMRMASSLTTLPAIQEWDRHRVTGMEFVKVTIFGHFPFFIWIEPQPSKSSARTDTRLTKLRDGWRLSRILPQSTTWCGWFTSTQPQITRGNGVVQMDGSSWIVVAQAGNELEFESRVRHQ